MSYRTIVALDLGKFKTVFVRDGRRNTHASVCDDRLYTAAIGQAVGQHVSIDPAQPEESWRSWHWPKRC